MISGVKIPGNSLRRDIQDKLLDVLGRLCTLYEKCAMIHKSIGQGAITLDKATVVGKFKCVKKSVMLVGDTSTQLSAKRREQVLTKLNPVFSSLGKDEFPVDAKQLFGYGFEPRLKLQSETANTVHQAKKARKQFFRGSSPRRFQVRFREQYRGFQGFYRPVQGLRSSTPYSGAEAKHTTKPPGSFSAKPTTSAVSLLVQPSYIQVCSHICYIFPTWHQLAGCNIFYLLRNRSQGTLGCLN